jgi:tricorn protease-like protein
MKSKLHLSLPVLTVVLVMIGISTMLHAQGQPGGKILYTLQQSMDHNIVYLLDDSGSPKLLTEGPLVWGVSWSPDGKQVLINRQHDGIGQLYSLADDGTNPVRLTSGDDHYYNPIWSPTGATIAFGRDNLDRRQASRLMLMSPDGSNEQVLYRGTAFFNVWSPDGTKVILTVDGKPLLVDIVSQQAAPLKIQGFEDQTIMISDWSADGKWFAFTHLAPGIEQIYIASLDGSNVRQAVADGASNRMLKWSADGSEFVFISTRDVAGGEVYRATNDGSQIQRLTFSGEHLDITTLAYWTPAVLVNTRVELPATLNWQPLAGLNTLSVNPEDPASVTRKVLTLLFAGDLRTEPDYVCDELQEAYLQASEAAAAQFADFDLANTVITVVTQGNDTAHVQLSGTMSLLISGVRSEVAASLLPGTTTLIPQLHLVYEAGWKLCTPF